MPTRCVKGEGGGSDWTSNQADLQQMRQWENGTNMTRQWSEMIQEVAQREYKRDLCTTGCNITRFHLMAEETRCIKLIQKIRGDTFFLCGKQGHCGAHTFLINRLYPRQDFSSLFPVLPIHSAFQKYSPPLIGHRIHLDYKMISYSHRMSQAAFHSKPLCS